MDTKFYSDKKTEAHIGDGLIYRDAIGTVELGTIESFLPAGDGADTKLTNGDVVIVGNCQRVCTTETVL